MEAEEEEEEEEEVVAAAVNEDEKPHSEALSEGPCRSQLQHPSHGPFSSPVPSTYPHLPYPHRSSGRLPCL